ncbi:MAG: transcription-repair coupling factor, partial [Gaiellales bacterium]
MIDEDDDENTSAPPPEAVAGLAAVTAAFAAGDDVAQVATRLGSTASVAARCAEAVLPLVVAALHARRADEDRAALSVVVADDDRARELADAVQALAPGVPVAYLPHRGVDWGSGLAPSPHLVGERAHALSVLAESGIVAVSADALVERLPGRGARPQGLRVATGDAHDRDDLVARLVAMGYERVEGAVDERGQVSVRGDLVDVFPTTGGEPVRIELFGDEVERLSSFSTLTQRSLRAVEAVTVHPASDGDVGDVPERLGDEGPHLPEGLVALAPELLAAGPLVLWDAPEVLAAGRERIDEIAGTARRGYLSHEQLTETLEGAHRLDVLPSGQPVAFEGHPPALAARGLAEIERALGGLVGRDLRVVLSFPHLGDAERAIRQLKRLDVAWLAEDEALPEEAGVYAVVAPLRRGLVAPTARIAVITGSSLFRSRRTAPARGGRAIASFGDLRPGDVVVHEDHGIGRFERFETRTVGGVTRDYIDLAFRGDDRLYLPHEQISKLTRYVGADGREPQLSKLGGKSWLQLKARARVAVREMAGELLALYAQRQAVPGVEHAEPGELLRRVEDGFPYSETDDQARAIEEVMDDLSQDRPMDRLICGDVGFGKTEVALRAAVRVIESGRQVLMLAPTTILAQQHGATFRSRLLDLPIRIEVVSRMRSAADSKQAVAAFKSGEVDLLLGTHRVLSRDVVPKDLGLVIVDEEQRFGVAQKELLRQMRTEVDVLALSATPIPRTLHMSLAGLRDISVIATPPRGRRPIHTHVGEYDDEQVAGALRREVERGGQAFYLHNRVETIEEEAARLAQLCPELRFGIGHGQLTERQLEDVMAAFLRGDFDVLVATTIIESGLDIPTANTLIVDRADLLGLSQLYQIRGRVGRSDVTAHAYLLYPDATELSEDARARLAALADYTELGSGFRVAMRDLELRGAGNLLGDEQSGHVAAVGFELYCDLLAEAVADLQGVAPEALATGPRIELALDAYVPAEYVGLEAVKM